MQLLSNVNNVKNSNSCIKYEYIVVILLSGNNVGKWLHQLRYSMATRG